MMRLGYAFHVMVHYFLASLDCMLICDGYAMVQICAYLQDESNH